MKLPIISEAFISSLIERGIALNAQWFQQDGATPHVANQTLKMLAETCADRTISDLNQSHFFLREYMKKKVYWNAPQKLLEWKQETSHQTCVVEPSKTLSGVFGCVHR